MADDKHDAQVTLDSIPSDLLQAKRIASARWLTTAAPLPTGPDNLATAAVAAAVRNVHAIGIGAKVVDGEPTGDQVIRFYVVQKLANHLLPEASRIPDQIDGIPTDVIESLPAAISNCSVDRRRAQRPVVPGISTSHFRVTAGTLGCFCRSTRANEDGQVFALSNNHVYANVNTASIGDALYQPGTIDGGTSADIFARLHRFQHITLGGTVGNRVDAAIGRVLDGIDVDPAICDIGQPAGIAAAAEGMPVRKHGRTTGFTQGVIDDVALDVKVGMSHSDPSLVALFEDQIRVAVAPPHAAFGLGGDSGSLVVTDDDPRAVGLFFAGPPGGAYGVANPIGAVFSALEIDLL